MALLANPSLGSSLKEDLFPKDVSIAEFCHQSFKTLWSSEIQHALLVTDEEKELLINNYLLNFYKVKCTINLCSIMIGRY